MKLKKFLKKANEIILSHIDDEDFNVGKLAGYLNLSRSQTLRKIKASTGFSANEYIREVRLQRAIELLRDENLTISEISYRVGYSNPSYFNKCFHDRFGHAPGDYRENILTEENSDHPVKNRYRKYVFAFLSFVILFLLIWWHQANFHTEGIENYSSIAVLPLQDYSKNQDQKYLALGLTDAITSELAKIKGLRVPSRGSAMYFKESQKDYRKIAKQLNVDLLLEGSVITQGEQLRVIIQLIDPTPNERHIWQNDYDKSSTDFLQLAANVSSEIAHEINRVISRETSIDKEVNVIAESWFLKGRYLWQKQHPDDVNLAIVYLKKAIAIDRQFSQAYFNLAQAYMMQNNLAVGSNEERYELRNQNRELILNALNKALECNNSLAEAYITKGLILGKFDWDWQGMKEMLDKGLKINPNSITGHVLLSDYYTINGLHEQAVKEIELAASLDPMNLQIACLVADKYIYHSDFDKAEKKLKEVLELDAYYGMAYNNLGFLYFLTGDKELALEMFTNLQVLLKNQDLVAFYTSNNFDESIGFWLDKVNNGEKMYCTNPHIIAMANQLGGRTDKTLEFLNLALEYKYSDLSIVMMHPLFSDLRAHPEFINIAKKLGLRSLN